MDDRPPLIDAAFLEALSEYIGADGVRDAVQVFLADATMRVARIRAVIGGNSVVVRCEAHALAGSAGALGLPRLVAATTALGNAAAAGRATQDHVAIVAALLELTMAALAAWAARLAPVS